MITFSIKTSFKPFLPTYFLVADMGEIWVLLRSWLDVSMDVVFVVPLRWKFMSFSHCQELGQQASWLMNWRHKIEQPIRSQDTGHWDSKRPNS